MSHMISGFDRSSLFQCQSDQPVCMVCHKQRNVQYVIIEFQIIKRKPDTELYLIREQFFDFLRLLLPVFVPDFTSTGNISFSR